MKSPALTARPGKNKKIDVLFNGTKLTSDTGVILLQKVDQKLQLSERIHQILHDPRNPRLTIHQQRDLLAQRIFAIALGYEDVNDQNDLRHDSALLAAIKNDTNEEFPLGSSSTLTRLENRITSQVLGVAVILGGGLSRKPSEQPHFYLIYKNKTTSVAVEPPKKQPHLPHFIGGGPENEVNEVSWRGDLVATEVVLFGKMR